MFNASINHLSDPTGLVTLQGQFCGCFVPVLQCFVVVLWEIKVLNFYCLELNCCLHFNCCCVLVKIVFLEILQVFHTEDKSILDHMIVFTTPENK